MQTRYSVAIEIDAVHVANISSQEVHFRPIAADRLVS